MARKRKVGYWASRGAYGVWINGVQHILAAGPDDFPDGPTYQAALDKYKDLVAVEGAAGAGDSNTLAVVGELYLRHLAASGKRASTVRIRQRCFQKAVDGGIGDVTVRELKPITVYQFCDRMRKQSSRQREGRQTKHTWDDGMVRIFLTSLQAGLAWAKRCGLTRSNPLDDLEMPARRSRGREATLSGEQFGLVRGRCSPALRELLDAWWATGARPAELFTASAADWDDRLGAIVYHPEKKRRKGEGTHKTGSKDIQRVIRFTGALLARMRELVRDHPAGPLFRSSDERANGLRKRPGWSATHVRDKLRAVGRELGLPGTLTPYTFRHSFATRMLMAGIGIEELAMLMGTSAQMIREHYSHVADYEGYLRERLERFLRIADGGGTESPPAGPPTADP